MTWGTNRIKETDFSTKNECYIVLGYFILFHFLSDLFIETVMNFVVII